MMVCGLFRFQARVSCGLEFISAPKLLYNGVFVQYDKHEAAGEGTKTCNNEQKA